MKRVTITMIAIFMIIIGSIIIVHGQELKINKNKYDIEITTNNDSISVVEKLTFFTDSNNTISFWIQDFPNDLKILIDDNEIEYYTSIIMGDNIYLCNISELNITTDKVISATYELDKDTDEFEKTLQYNTSSLTITFDDKKIYTGTNLKASGSIKVALQKETQGTTTETVETIPSWIYIIIIILVILLLASFIRPSKKQKTTKKKETTVESEELLSTKKVLLMEVLKDIEKKHRAEKISDDTYHKLRDQYKQEAVETMRLLEKSKVK